VDVNFATCAYLIKDRSKGATENALKRVKACSSKQLDGCSVDAPPSPVLLFFLIWGCKDNAEEEEEE